VTNIGLKTAGKYCKTIFTRVYPIKTKISGDENEMPVKLQLSANNINKRFAVKHGLLRKQFN